jgi:hypothetical protein
LEWTVVRLDRRRSADGLSLELAKGVDVFVTSATGHGRPRAMKFGMPPIIVNTDRPGAQPHRDRLHVQQDSAASRDGDAPELRRGNDPRIVSRIRVITAVVQFGARHRRRQRHRDAVWT